MLVAVTFYSCKKQSGGKDATFTEFDSYDYSVLVDMREYNSGNPYYIAGVTEDHGGTFDPKNNPKELYKIKSGQLKRPIIVSGDKIVNVADKKFRRRAAYIYVHENSGITVIPVRQIATRKRAREVSKDGTEPFKVYYTIMEDKKDEKYFVIDSMFVKR